MSQFDDSLAEVARRQRAHVDASHKIDRTGWTREQWIEDAERLMGDLDGSVLDLVNGHVLALLNEIQETKGIKEVRWYCLWCGTVAYNHRPPWGDNRDHSIVRQARWTTEWKAEPSP